MPHAIDSVISAAETITPFPAAASKLVTVCGDETRSSLEVVRVLESDTSLAGRVLALANSSLYGHAGRIRTVNQAVVTLGFRKVREVALAAAAVAMHGNELKQSDAQTTVWRHSLSCAAIARELADLLNQADADEAFLAGLFHDVGKSVLLSVDPDTYQRLVQTCQEESVLRHEREQFGGCHQMIGALFLQRAGLPKTITMPVRHHHSPTEAVVEQELVRVTSAANRLAKHWMIESEKPFLTTCIDEELNLPSEADVLSEVWSRSVDAIRAWASFLAA